MEKQKNSSLLKRLLPYMGEKRFLFPLALVFAALSSVSGVLPFLYIHKVVRVLLFTPDARDWRVISSAAWMALLFAFVTVLLYFFALLMSHIAAFRLENAFQRKAMHKIFRRPLGFFTKHPSGFLRKTVRAAGMETHGFIAHNLPDLATAVVTPILLLILMFYIDWRLALASFCPILIGFIVMGTLTGHGKELRENYFKSLQEMSAGSVEYVRAIPVVKTFGQSVRSFNKFYNSIINYRDLVMSFTLAWTNPYTFYTVIMESAAFFMVPLAILLFGRGEPLPQLLADYVFYLIVAPVFSSSMMRVMMLSQNKMRVQLSLDSYDALFTIAEHTQATEPKHPQDYSLSFEHVSFSYDKDGPPVLSDLSFKLKPGESLALVGMSGGGKTTLARLAARFWEPDRGEIRIGDVNIKDIPKTDLMDMIAFVFQNAKLHKGSLRENILYGRKDVSEAELMKAIELSQSAEIIDALPAGLETVIGSEGTYLSGGEQQRIALARAILKDAPIVLLDEATAFADPENEYLIQEALKELRKDKTSIMIAHRLSSVTDVDRIMVIGDGRILQEGSHAELIAEEGQYRRMWEEYQRATKWSIVSEEAPV